MKRSLVVCGSVVLLSGLLLLPGCGARVQGPDIVCTTGMVADVVRNVVGERYTVGQLMGEGVDPHLYQETPGDARQLAEAKLIFYSGLGLEGRMGDLFRDMRKQGKPTCAIADRIDDRLVLKNDER